MRPLFFYGSYEPDNNAPNEIAITFVHTHEEQSSCLRQQFKKNAPAHFGASSSAAPHWPCCSAPATPSSPNSLGSAKIFHQYQITVKRFVLGVQKPPAIWGDRKAPVSLAWNCGNR